MGQSQSKVNDYNGKFRRKCSYAIAQSDNKKNLSPVDSLTDLKRLYNIVIKDTGFHTTSAKFYLSELQENYKKDSFKKNFLSRTYKISEFKNVFIVNKLKTNGEKVKFKGPELSISCEISDIKTTNYERKIGFVKTLKENEILLLDCRKNNKPFYSTESYKTIPAHETFPSTQTYDITLFDSPNCRRPLNRNSIFQKFVVYLVEESMKNRKDGLKYEVLFSFDWFIDLKWIGETQENNNNIFEYECGINEHMEPFEKLPELIDSKKKYPCNDYIFENYIQKKKKIAITENAVEIVKYPNSFYKEKLNTLEENLKDITSACSKQKKLYEDIVKRISVLQLVCEKKCKMASELVMVVEKSNYTDLSRHKNITEQESTISESSDGLSLNEDEDYNAFKHIALREKENFGLNLKQIQEVQKMFEKCKALRDDLLCDDIKSIYKSKEEGNRRRIEEAVIKKNLANKQDKQSISNNNQNDQFEQTFDNA